MLEMNGDSQEKLEEPCVTPASPLGVDSVVVEEPTGCFGQFNPL